MLDEDFFQRLKSEFCEHRALATEVARCDEQAERHLATAEYELTQAHRALTNVLVNVQTPDAGRPHPAGGDEGASTLDAAAQSHNAKAA